MGPAWPDLLYVYIFDTYYTYYLMFFMHNVPNQWHCILICFPGQNKTIQISISNLEHTSCLPSVQINLIYRNSFTGIHLQEFIYNEQVMVIVGPVWKGLIEVFLSLLIFKHIKHRIHSHYLKLCKYSGQNRWSNRTFQTHGSD